MKVGFVVNPYAGSGGRTGHKGSDDLQLLNPETPKRLERFFGRAPREVVYVTASCLMGSSYIPEGFSSVDVGVGCKERTTREDTMNAVEKFIEHRVSLIVFAGGDGTARDVAEALNRAGAEIPILGIPTGVKMHSGVFAETPEKAGDLLRGFVQGKVGLKTAEVLDLDEESYRRGVYLVRKFYSVLTLTGEGIVSSKVELRTEEESVKGIAEYFREFLYDPKVVYVFGPGSTVKYLERELFSVSGPFLSTDIVVNGELVKTGATYEDLLRLTGELRLVVTPIGGQGFLFGRGNQEIGPEFLRRVGKDNIIVVSTREKLRTFDCLRIDTGDEELDRLLSGTYKILVDYNEFYAIYTC